MSNEPAYTSLPSLRGFYQSYLIFSDRVELECRLPFLPKSYSFKKEDIVSVEICPPPVIRKDLWALKMDLADLFTHVRLEVNNSKWKRFHFTPDDPQEFVDQVKKILNN